MIVHQAPCLLYLAAVLATVSALSPHPKVLLISFDGFRYDLLNETMVPNIFRWAQDSVWFVNGSQSQYSSFTAPNHMGIVTGLYGENNGIVGNNFFDPDTQTQFDYYFGSRKKELLKDTLKSYWYKGEPIWLTNERDNATRHSSAFYWPNCEARFPSSPHTPTSFVPWTRMRSLSEWKSDVESIANEFTKEDGPSNLVTWYVGEPDNTLHYNGFYNGVFHETIGKLDELFAHFVTTFEKKGLFESVNVIFTADHGHAQVEDEKHVMCLRDYLNFDFKWGEHMIYPKDEAQAQEIYRNLTKAIDTHKFGVKVYFKEDLPERFHFSKTNRIGRIVLEPMLGSNIDYFCTGSKMQKEYGVKGKKFSSSTHGQDPENPEMRAVLLMKGPQFAKNKQITDVPMNVDLYPLLCELLNISPLPNNGTLTVVGQALLSSDNYLTRGVNIITNQFGSLALLFPLFVALAHFVARCCRRKNPVPTSTHQITVEPVTNQFRTF